MQSLPVVIIRCEENEIYQLDFRIETDNIRCFILLSGLQNFITVQQIRLYILQIKLFEFFFIFGISKRKLYRMDTRSREAK